MKSERTCSGAVFTSLYLALMVAKRDVPIVIVAHSRFEAFRALSLDPAP